jgi:dTDP-4-dehydrorhamnose reductase
MKRNNVLLTGSSGKLGKAIIKSNLFLSLLCPKREELDITVPDKISSYFQKNDFSIIVHCAALARMKECEKNPQTAIDTNIIGTANLVNGVLDKQETQKREIRFILISTDGVYNGTKGNYSETDETIPYNNYGWSKLGAECSVKKLKNHVIVRTGFFDPKNIRFDDSATDTFSSRLEIEKLVESILKITNSDFIGTINIGGERMSDYKRYVKYKPSLKECRFKDVLEYAKIPLAKDASMDCTLWNKIRKSI